MRVPASDSESHDCGVNATNLRLYNASRAANPWRSKDLTRRHHLPPPDLHKSKSKSESKSRFPPFNVHTPHRPLPVSLEPNTVPHRIVAFSSAHYVQGLPRDKSEDAVILNYASSEQSNSTVEMQKVKDLNDAGGGIEHASCQSIGVDLPHHDLHTDRS